MITSKSVPWDNYAQKQKDILSEGTELLSEFSSMKNQATLIIGGRFVYE